MSSNGTSPALNGLEEAYPTSFYIAAREPQHRPRKTLKHNDTFVLLDEHGDIGAIGTGPEGLFDGDTRYLSRFEVIFAGMPLLRLGSSITADSCCLHADLTSPDIYRNGALVQPKDRLHITRAIFVTDGVLWHRMRVTNHGPDPIEGALSVCFDADFVDIFELRGIRRTERGKIVSTRVDASRATRSYIGLDAVARHVDVAFAPPPNTLSATIATYQLALAPRQRLTILTTVRCRRGEGDSALSPAMPRIARAERMQVLRDGAELRTSNPALNDILSRARADLAMLTTKTEQGPVPYAGIPWFSTTFGRDALITAMQMLWLQPALARGVLCRLAALQATHTDAANEAEPGKIVHEMRSGEMATCREVPFGRYYGSVDATPLFLMLLGMYVARTGDITLLRRLWTSAELALGWLDRAEAEGDGLIRYARSSADGLINQGWKDSSDAVFHADGRLAGGAIALIEVQAYTCAARRWAARCADLLSKPDLADNLRQQAAKLAAAVDESFWTERLNCYALALDGDGHRCAVVASNAGHLLFTGIDDCRRAQRLGQRLMAVDMYSGWGIRTVSANAPRFNPMSYHNGSVWPHDTAIIGAGLCRYGMQKEASMLFDGLAQSALSMEQRRLPELFCGFPRRQGRGPTSYPVACSPQAWASGALFMLIGALIGIEIEPERDTVLFRRPTLPQGVSELVITGLDVGRGCVDVLLRRENGETALSILRATDGIRVSLANSTPNMAGDIPASCV